MQVRNGLFLPVSPEGHVINTYGAGDVNLETLKLKGRQGTLPALECKVRQLYGHFNLAWQGDQRTSGLMRIELWVNISLFKGTWIPATSKGVP